MTSSLINIIYIVSSGHSGSTLLDLMLGSHSAIHSGGEFYKFPRKLETDNGILHPCSCGEKVIHCDFWRRAAEGANTDFDAIRTSRDFFSLYDRMIPSILSVTGKTHFVDSSKGIPRLNKYLNSSQFQVSIIHLIRDPRAVAYSFARKRRRMLAKKGGSSQKLNPLTYYHFLWMNLRGNLRFIMELSKQRVFHTIQYEELVARPRQVLSGFLERIHLPFEDSMIEYYDQTHHIVGGNHMRLQKRPLMLDREYLQSLSMFQWAAGTCISLPLLLKYRYPLLRRS